MCHILHDTNTKLITFVKKAYLFLLLRLHKNQTTATKTINSITDTTTAIAIIVPLESPSLLDTSPCGLERSDVVDDVVMVSIKLVNDVRLLVSGLTDDVGDVSVMTPEMVDDVSLLVSGRLPEVVGDISLLVSGRMPEVLGFVEGFVVTGTG